MAGGQKEGLWSQADPPCPPQGEMAATPAGFAQLTHLLMGLAEGKLILSLEVSDSLQPMDPGRQKNNIQIWQKFLPQHFHLLAGQPHLSPSTSLCLCFLYVRGAS